MARALELAALGLGSVAPNPMVGCVIMHDNKIIAEGWHQQFGGPHAEVNAVRAVADPATIANSTIYVSLEPCSHYGKTPPCADLLVELKPARVVVANMDPNPKVAGNGIKRLQAHGIEVDCGVLEAEGRMLNRRFFTMMEQKRPYIILKWAQTADGFIARKNYDSKWISNTLSRKLVHKWRSEEQAILVGHNTALHDDPSLTTRDWPGQSPLRIALDPKGRLPASLKLFSDGQETLHISNNEQQDAENYLKSTLDTLYEKGIASVIVEGGSHTLQQFIDFGLWDEARVFTANTHFIKGIAAPVLHGHVESSSTILTDELKIYRNEQ